MPHCSICNKDYKRLQDLKSHNTKLHPIVQIAEPIIIGQEQEIQLAIMIPNDTLSIEFSEPIGTTQEDSEFDSEIDFNLSEESDDAIYISRPRRKNKPVMIDSSCQWVEPAQLMHKSALKVNGIFIETEKLALDKLPAICDDIKVFNGRLQVLVHNITYDISNLQIFNQYEPTLIDFENRVQPRKSIQYKRVSYNQYISDNREQPTFLNMRKDNQGNQFPALLAKLHNENDIKCELKTPLNCYFDIETFDTDLTFKAIPLASRSTSHISMISLITEQRAILFHQNIYSFNTETAQQTIFAHCGQHYDIETIKAESENELVLQFIMALKQLSADNTIILSGFNSSNDNKGEKIMGYDCSFILRNLKSSIKIEKRRCNGSGEFPSQLIQIACLPNVYFCDMMLMYDENTKVCKKEIQGMSLNSYLKFYQVPLKLDGNHEEQRPVQINGGDISLYGAYCLYDSICLQLVAQKHHIIAQRLSYCQKFGLPLSVCLYQTPVNLLTCHLMKEFYKQGYMFSYSKIGAYVENRKKQGAMTQQCPIELQYKSLQNVHIFDFASQYPNVGIQNNISPETYSNEYQNGFYKVQINYQKDQPDDFTEDQKIFAYFDNTKTGIISDFQRQIFDERVQTKKLQKGVQGTEWLLLEVKQLALKEMINSMYGAQNDSNGQLYKYECGSSITGGGRQLLDSTIKIAEQVYQTKRLFADTDSLALQYCGSDVKSKFNVIQQLIGVNNPRMTLEYEKAYKYVMYPENLKSYANMGNDGKVIVKGVPFNKYSLEHRDTIMSLFSNILINTDSTPVAICQSFTNTCAQLIKTLVNQQDVSGLAQFVNIRKSNKLVTKTGNQTLAGFLKYQHPEIQHFNTIPYNCHTQKSLCHIPIEMITPENIKAIRVNDLVAHLVQPFKTFFKMGVPKSESACGKVKSGQVAIKYQKGTGYSKMKVFDRDEIINLIAKNGSHTSYHEIMVNDVNKCYFDIEHETLSYTAYKLTIIIQEVLQNFNVRIHIGDGSKVNKMSYHIVVEIKTNKSVNLYIATLINARLGNICDLKVYKTNSSLRLPNCVKIDADTGVVEHRKIKPLTASQPIDFFISDNVDRLPDYSDFISFSQKCTITDASQFGFNIKNSAVISLLKQHNIEASMTRNNQIDIKKKPYQCPACQDTHRSNNLKLCGDRIKCYTEGCCGLLVEDKVKVEPKILPLIDSLIQHNYNVDYSLDTAHHTYVKSQMGTGKTEKLKKLLDCAEYPVVVVISFRRTFADEFSTKMGFVNYQAIGSGDIKTSQNNRICIQYESLHKLEIDCDINLVVCDEIESILGQITAFEKKENNQNNLKLIELLRNKSLIMDALLQQSTIDLIQNITGVTNTTTFENTYQMQSVRQMFVDTKPTDEKIINQILADLHDDKKVVVNCCTKVLAKEIRRRVILMGKRVAIYDGDNNEVLEQFGITQTMGSHKKQQLQAPNDYWTQTDCLIYTATISAGVSCTAKHFNVHYGILVNKSSDVIAFTQGNHRVRDLSDNVHKIFIFNMYHEDRKTTCVKISETQNSFNSRSVYTRNNQIQQLNIYLQARANTLRLCAKQLFLLWSKQAGYQIVMDGVQEERVIVMPEQIVQMPESPSQIVLTEQEFTDLPRQMRQNDFSLTHCDPQMTQKMEVVFIAGVYNKTYSEIMNIFEHKEQWDLINTKQNIERRINRNLAKIALTKTKQIGFTTEAFPEIHKELLEYHNHMRHTQSLITTNLNIATDFQKTKYIETFISGIDAYLKVQQALTNPEAFNEYLLTLSKKKEGAVNIIKTLLKPLEFELHSDVTEKKVTIDGKRKTERTYQYSLKQIECQPEFKQYLE